MRNPSTLFAHPPSRRPGRPPSRLLGSRARPLALTLPLLDATALVTASDEAHAAERVDPGEAIQAEVDDDPGDGIDRDGGQIDILVGGSGCIPARGDCRFDANNRTKGSVGLAFDLGWRAHRAFFIGGSYTIGWFTPTWKLGPEDRREYRNAYQQGVFAVLRAYIPVWRIDIGLELSPGWSQATFVAEGSELRQISHGFALRPGVSFDFRLGEHLFLGARVDFLANFHTRFCTKDGERECGNQRTVDQLPVHQVIGGVHFGANF